MIKYSVEDGRLTEPSAEGEVKNMELLNQIIDAVKDAAVIYRSAKDDLQIETKGDKNNLVTVYDKRIQDFLYKRLREILPGCAFLGEEGDGEKTVPDGYCFIIDPIDGTTNFIRGFAHSAICVGLAKQKKLLAGVVYDVDKNDLYSAEKGRGAFLNGKQIHVHTNDIEQSVVLFGTSPYNRENARRTFDMAEKVFMKALELRRTGSAALDICYVASGKADLYFECVTHPWDWAGASLILTEAGGIIQTLEKEPLPINAASSILCGNAVNTKEFFEIVE